MLTQYNQFLQVQLDEQVGASTALHPLLQENADLIGMTLRSYLRMLLSSDVNLRVMDPQTKKHVEVQWIAGHLLGGFEKGPQRADIAIIGKMPGSEELAQRRFFVGPSGQEILSALQATSLTAHQINNIYVTNVLHFKPPGKKTQIVADHIKMCEYILYQELAIVRPQYVLLLGADAVKSVFGKSITMRSVRSAVFDSTHKFGGKDSKLELLHGAKVMATIHPAAVLREPSMASGMCADVKRFSQVVDSGGDFKEGPTTEYEVITNVGRLKQIVDWILECGITEIGVDAEWSGNDYLTGSLRCIQISWEKNQAIVIALRDVNGNEVFRPSLVAVVNEIRKLFIRKETVYIGHNLRADLKWLVHLGVDMSVCQKFDTMNAHHILHETGSQGLKECAVKFTDMGRYDYYLMRWLEDNKSKDLDDEDGFGDVPDNILHPYGAADADATLRLYHIFKSEIEKDSKLSKLFYVADMAACMPLLEIEMTGVMGDRAQMEELTEIFNVKRDELTVELRKMIDNPKFNPRSSLQVQQLLFDKPENGGLGLDPIKTTNKTQGRLWSDVIYDPTMDYDEKKSPHQQDRFSPATDGEVLDILAFNSPITHKLHEYRVIDQICKNFLPRPEKKGVIFNYKKGLISHMHKDDRIRSTFSQMTETGRYRSSKPNMQNLPKKQEDEIVKIMGSGVPTIRSCFIAPPGWKLIEADFMSAEVVVLAYLAHDEQLKKDAFAAPDMHSINAVDMLGAKCSPFEVRKHPIYKGYRVAAKSVTFGIPYGRGALALAREVQRKGVTITVNETKAAITAYFNKYPGVAAFVEDCHRLVSERGYVENAFGRRRRFLPASDRSVLAAQQREAVNFPIQGTVADLLNISIYNLWLMRRHRPELRYRILLPVHDAIILEVPDEQVEEVSNVVLPVCMGDIEIPGYGVKLGLEIDVFERWGVDLK